MKGWRRKGKGEEEEEANSFQQREKDPEPICSEVGGKKGKGNVVVEERGTRGNKTEGTWRGKRKQGSKQTKAKGGKLHHHLDS